MDIVIHQQYFFFCPRKGCLTIIAMTFNALIIHADTFYLSFSQWNEFDAEGGGSGDGGDSKRRRGEERNHNNWY